MINSIYNSNSIFSCFILGIQVSCPFLYCNSKNSTFQNAGRFPSGKNSSFYKGFDSFSFCVVNVEGKI